MRTLPLLLLALVVSALAGCGGKDGPTPTGGPPVGSLQGRVVDPSEAPIEGAAVKVLLTNLSATTDASGDFVLHDVPIGTLRVVATKDGFSTSTRTAELATDRTLFLHFTLAEVRVPTPYHRKLDHNGEILCGLPAGTSCAALDSENPPFRFPVEPHLRGIVVELEWQPPAEGASARLAVDIHAASAEACGDKYAGGEGPPVLRLVVLDGFPITGGHQCAVVRPGADTASAQQGYSLHATLFYHEPPPDGFTALT